MTVKELIEELNLVAAKYGNDMQCVLHIDEDDCRTELELTDVFVNSYFDSPIQKIALYGTLETYEEPEPLEDDED